MKANTQFNRCVLLASLMTMPSLHADITNPAEDFFNQRTEIRMGNGGDREPNPGILFVKTEADDKAMPWLGVATESLPKALAAQLGIENGVVVSAVVPESPAEKAGIADYDILLKMDGVELDSPETFRELVRGQAKGDKVTIQLMRKGEKVDVEAELSEKSVAEVRSSAPPSSPQPRRSPRSLFDDDFFKSPLFDGMGFGRFGGLGNMKEIEEHMRRIQEEMQARFEDMGDLGGGSAMMQMQNSVMSYSDNEGSVKIEKKDGKTHVEMRDPDGKVVFDGPANTPEERQKLPPKVVEKLEGLENSRIDFDFGGFRLDPPTLGPSDEDLPKLQPKVRRKSEVEKEKKNSQTEGEADESTDAESAEESGDAGAEE